MGGDEVPVMVDLVEAPRPPVIPMQPPPAPPPPPPPPEPEPAPEPEPVVAEPPPAPEPKPVFEVKKPKPKPPKPKPKPKPQEPPPPPPPPEPPPPAPPAPEPPPPAPPTPPAPAAPPTQEPANAPANARYDPGSGTPGKQDLPVLSDKQVSYLRKPNPVYPAFSKRAGETGTVMLRMLVDEKGVPVKIDIEKSSGFPRLDQAAVTAAKASRYTPHVRDGKPQQMIARVPIVFDLE